MSVNFQSCQSCLSSRPAPWWAFVALWIVLPAVHAQSNQGLNQNLMGEPPTQVPFKQEAVQLKTSPLLKDRYGKEEQLQLPTFVFGQQIVGRASIDLVIEGEAEIRRAGTVIRADRMDYDYAKDFLKARGNVRINREGNIYTGSAIELKVDSSEGTVSQAHYQLLKNGATGFANRIDLLSSTQSVLHQTSYTTCRREDVSTQEKKSGKAPDWELVTEQLRIDDDNREGTAKNAVFKFKDVPVLAWPSLSFAIDDGRKTGWLPPTFNLDTVSGFELIAPYYVNLAPNRDATLYASTMSKRGLNYGAEFRYLETDYRGNLRFDQMPNDSLRGRNRWGLTAQHTGKFALDAWSKDWNAPSLAINLNRVSDDNYWKDFPRGVAALHQRLLSNDLTATWSQGSYALAFRTQRWQTLQDAASPIIPPYDRLPQITAQYSRPALNDWDYGVVFDSVRYAAASNLTGQPNTHRSYVQAHLSYPWQSPAAFVKPRIQIHARQYDFDAPLTGGAFAGSKYARVTVPTFSLDSGLIFERPIQAWGKDYTQSLEPRAYYTYSAYRRQDGIPLYDTSAYDFNSNTVFQSNAFTGNDRLSDNNLLTLGLTSRYLYAATGAEHLRLNLAQRFRFADQRVTLPGGAPDTTRISDILLGASLSLQPELVSDVSYQYNRQSARSERTTFTTRYTPSLYRTLNLNYAFARSNLSQQVDLGWQWPINDLWRDKGENLGRGQGQGAGRWYTVGRMNYSVKDKKWVDGILGFEYDEGCWLARVVSERLQTGNTSATKRIMLQIEFVGMGRVGNNPLATLRNYIPRYQLLREKISTTPSRYSQYE